MRKIYFLVAVLFVVTVTKAQVFTENFQYTIGENLTSHGWTAHSGGGTQPIDVTNGLTFSGYAGSGIGGAANLDNNGEDVNRTFTEQTSGTVYVSFLVQAGSTNNAGYFFHLGQTSIGTTFFSRVWVNGTGTGLGIGTNAPSSYIPISANTIYLVVVKYEFSSKVSSLYVFSSLPTSEPTSADQTFTETATINNVGSVALRQYNAAQRQIVDGIIVATSWEDIFESGTTPTQAATPTFSPVGGTYYTAQDVTINTTTEDATIYYTTDGSDPDESSPEYTVPVTVSSTTTLKAIAVAAGLDNSNVGSATYTIAIPTEVATIAALRAGSTDGTVYKLTGEAVLTLKTANRNAKYVQDATAGILIDDNPGAITTNYNTGDGITGITGTLSVFSGMLQFLPVADPGAATSTGNTITPIETTLDELDVYPAMVVKVDGITVSGSGNFAAGANYPITDGINNGVLRTAYNDLDYIGTPIPAVELTSVTGVVLIFNTTAQLVPRNLADFEYPSCTEPLDVTGAGASPGTNTATVSWTIPVTCADEVLVVASAGAANSGTPSGSPAAYTADANFEDGDALGNGFVVYKGSGASVNVTGLTNGTQYYFKIFTYSNVAADWSDGVEVDATPQTASSATDYFRSQENGNWGDPSTWESSADGNTWQGSTLVPTEESAGITISHTVTTNGAVTADQVVIESGGILVNASTSGNRIIFNDGDGNDLIIKNGGVYQITSGLGYTNFQTLNDGATIKIESGGIIRLGAGGGLGGGSLNSFVTTPARYIWDDGSIFEWNATATPGATGVTYFPDADETTVPVLRFTTAPAGNIGGGTALTVKGVLEANTAVNFGGNGAKIFRNGIRGTGTVTQAASSGGFVINGADAVLGGPGNIVLSSPLAIDGGTETVLTSHKTISGDINFVNGKITIGNYFLTVNSVEGGSPDSYVVTNGEGRLVQQITTDKTDYLFPVGTETQYQQALIEFESNPASGGRLEGRFVAEHPGTVGLPLYPPDASDEINTVADEGYWEIKEEEIAAGFTNTPYTATFTARNFYSIRDYTKLYLLKRSETWEPWTLEGTHVTTTGSNEVAILQRTGLIGFSNFSVGGELFIALPVHFGYVKAVEQGSGIRVEWNNLTESNMNNYVVERSADGRSFTALGTVTALRNDGSRSDYNYFDAAPLNGVNFYRIRSVELDGKVAFSIIVRVDTRNISATQIAVYPNPVKGGQQLSLQASSLAQGQYTLRIVNAGGQQVYAEAFNHSGGFITQSMQLPASLKAGMYYLQLSSSDTQLTKAVLVQ